MKESDNEEPKPPAEPAEGLETAGRTDPMDGLVHPPPGSIPVVGLGGSAGSLDALSSFVSKIPPDSGAAYVIVVHLSPEYDYMLPEILQRETSLPVKQVEGRATLEKNQIYVISPGKQLSITEGTLESIDFERPKGRHITIDVFFRTLAETHGVNSCAIVLSGADGDGALGIKRVKERGGLTIVQDPSEAEFDGMPRASIVTGMIDWILPASEIPARLAEYWSNTHSIRLPFESDSGTLSETDESSLKEILSDLNDRCGHDFGDYKRATIVRRVGRRMQVNGTRSLADYLAYLRSHPGESGALLQDLLISVTNYFRDSPSFRVLEDSIPSLFEKKSGSSHIRVWIPACATGEEAYSIAMLLCEYAEKLTHPPSIQIFATDLDQRAIDIAREGKYPQSIAADVPEVRLRRFFTPEEGGYRVKRGIRDTILFAMHDLLRDSPFSRLDLISCRNLLIYLNREAQRKVFDIFHFSLRPEGKLFLGSSESVEESTGLFDPIDKKHRLYVRKEVKRIGLPLPSGRSSFSSAGNGVNNFHRLISNSGGDGEQNAEMPNASSPADLHLRLIERLAAPSIVLNHGHDIIHLSKNAGKYLHIEGGEPSTNLLKLIHPNLRTIVRALLFQATDSISTVKSRNLPFHTGEVDETVTITVKPVDLDSRDFLLVIFEGQDVAARKEDDTPEIQPSEQSLIRQLEKELDQMRSTWRDTGEEYEASVEELKASNEELHAMNEELRSTTEEMETGREELQSINEEVITINSELKGKVEDLARANSDLQNLMASTKIATIFLDLELRIKLFTPAATDIFSLIPSDEGRPLADLSRNLKYPEIRKDAIDLLENLAMVEREVRGMGEKWFLVRMSPYRTEDNVIGGVVITCIDITERKKNEESRRWLSSVVESCTDAVISYNVEGNIVSWNKGAERIFGYTTDEIIGEPHTVLEPESLQCEKTEKFRNLYGGEIIEPFETVRMCKDGKEIDVSLSASVIRGENGEVLGATAVARDITDRKQAVKDLRDAHDQLEDRVKERTIELQSRIDEIARMASEITFAEDRERKRMARVLHDELQQLLVSAKMGIESLNELDDEARKQETSKLRKLMGELIENSRSLSIDLSPPVLSETLGRALEWLCFTWIPEKHQLSVQADIDLLLDAKTEEIRSIVFYSVRELLFNVVKHSKVLEAHVELVPHGDGDLKVTVRDHGLGFDISAKSAKSGKATGFGLIGLRERLEMLGGKFMIRSRPNEGVEAVIIAPRNNSNDK